MEGTIQTPLGAVKKQTAMIGGGVALLIVGVVYYRSKKQAAAAAVASAGANTEINPATGYPFGSAEDAAALSHQASYQSPSGGGGGGGSSYVGTSPGSFVSNAQWAQYCEQYLVNNSMITDQVILGNAVGKYLSGQPMTPDMASLVQQCIAIGGLPPVAGPSGYPPSINTSPTPANPPVNTPPAPSGGGSGQAMKTIHVSEGQWLKTILPPQWQSDYGPFFAANPGVKVVEANHNGYIGPKNPRNPNDPSLTWVFPYAQEVKVPA